MACHCKLRLSLLPEVWPRDTEGMSLEVGKARVPCLPRCTSGNLQDKSLEVGKPNFPSFQKQTLEIPGGTSLESGEAGQALPGLEGPDLEQEFPVHTGQAPPSPRSAHSGRQESACSSGCPSSPTLKQIDIYHNRVVQFITTFCQSHIVAQQRIWTLFAVILFCHKNVHFKGDVCFNL